MLLTKEQAKKNLIRLVEKYQEVANQDRIKDYNEEATKTAFIQPFLKDVLGWDVNDYNEVSPEERISRGRVDYCLKIDGKPKIFVEAKPLKADLKKHIEQAVRYGYNRKGVPFVLLTDFEEIKLFDVTLKPDIKNPKKGLKLDLYWKWYEDNFDKLWQLSKESVISGELDKLLLAKPKDRIPVDKAILVDLEDWRETLAKDIYKNNPHLFRNTTEAQRHKESPGINSVSSEPPSLGGEFFRNADYLKEITQRILDRIIFMRFCEDRQFVHGQTLRELFEDRTEQVGTTTMVFLAPKFKQFDITFDSDLFSHKDWENNLQIDFRVMNKIVLDTYNPYQFDVIPLEVLGNIYEQYLGYTIRLTPQMVKYELKPEVRKAGGVYYTPEYIVDYIVKNTVGKLLKEATPQKIRKLRILDPACGSGSFLIRAYEEMLNYYKEQKKKNKPRMNTDKHGNVGQGFSLADSESYEDTIQKELDLKHSDTEIRLSIQEKAEILKNHIFGVDIDEQAVEVTKLSLMLKMLEGEFGIIPGRNILPMLDKNIRCGNSLISGSPIELKKFFGDDYYKVGFNWEEEFKDIFKDGGFDVVIGNPPYILIQDLFRDDNSLRFFRDKYISSSYKIDTYHLFFERGIDLLKKNGLLGYISPSNYLTNNGLVKMRLNILNKCTIEIINVIDGKVFTGASVDTAISIYRKGESDNKSLFILSTWDTEKLSETNTKKFKQNVFLENQNHLFTATKETKINVDNFELGEKYLVKFGMQLRDRTKFTSDVITKAQKLLITKYHKQCYTGKDINRYHLEYGGLLAFVNLVAKQGGCWDMKVHLSIPKILVRQIGKSPICALDEKGYYCLNTLFMIVPIDKDNQYSLKYILSILNSKYISHFWANNFYDMRQTFPKIKGSYLEKIPIRIIDFSNLSEKYMHDELVALVDVMLDLNKKIQTAKGNAKEHIQREITKTDTAIDDIVYKLYGIAEQERKIIEQV